jgi:hypothetical protein
MRPITRRTQPIAQPSRGACQPKHSAGEPRERDLRRGEMEQVSRDEAEPGAAYQTQPRSRGPRV